MDTARAGGGTKSLSNGSGKVYNTRTSSKSLWINGRVKKGLIDYFTFYNEKR